eukprot:4799806-Alexandrium_andersonii.AAC.1
MPEAMSIELGELRSLDPRDVLVVVFQEAVPALLVALEAVQDGEPSLGQQVVHLLDIWGGLVVLWVPEEGGGSSPTPTNPGASLPR